MRKNLFFTVFMAIAMICTVSSCKEKVKEAPVVTEPVKTEAPAPKHEVVQLPVIAGYHYYYETKATKWTSGKDNITAHFADGSTKKFVWDKKVKIWSNESGKLRNFVDGNRAWVQGSANGRYVTEYCFSTVAGEKIDPNSYTGKINKKK